jgi:hypothetical protein
VDGGGVEAGRDAMPGLRGAAVMMSASANQYSPCIHVDASSCEELCSAATWLRFRLYRFQHDCAKHCVKEIWRIVQLLSPIDGAYA